MLPLSSDFFFIYSEVDGLISVSLFSYVSILALRAQPSRERFENLQIPLIHSSDPFVTFEEILRLVLRLALGKMLESNTAGQGYPVDKYVLTNIYLQKYRLLF